MIQTYHFNMYGIIYKFTSLTLTDSNGNNYFYVGQHICSDLDLFKKQNKRAYWGSGGAWNRKVLKPLKQKYPTCWHKLIKREILRVSYAIQPILSISERYFIDKTNAQYIRKMGGLNWQEGCYRNYMSDEELKQIISYKLRNGSHADMSGKNNPMYGVHGRISGDKNPMKDKEVAERNSLSRLGKKRTVESRRRMSEAKRGKYIGKDNPNFGKKWTDEMKLRMSLKKKGLL